MLAIINQEDATEFDAMSRAYYSPVVDFINDYTSSFHYESPREILRTLSLQWRGYPHKKSARRQSQHWASPSELGTRSKASSYALRTYDSPALRHLPLRRCAIHYAIITPYMLCTANPLSRWNPTIRGNNLPPNQVNVGKFIFIVAPAHTNTL